MSTQEITAEIPVASAAYVLGELLERHAADHSRADLFTPKWHRSITIDALHDALLDWITPRREGHGEGEQ